jgi:hypothetical protein
MHERQHNDRRTAHTSTAHQNHLVVSTQDGRCPHREICCTVQSHDKQMEASFLAQKDFINTDSGMASLWLSICPAYNARVMR